MIDRIGKSYRMNNLGLGALVGRHIISAKINNEHDLVVLETSSGPLFLTWEGDCCAHCYIENISGSEALIDSTIIEALNAEWTDVRRDGDEFDVLESMGTNIKTTKGYVSFETRLEHNGFYSGQILVSDDEPMDTYSSPRYENGLPDLMPLKDF